MSLMTKHTQVCEGSTATGKDELDRYLADVAVPTDDPLHWWIMNRKVYPTLAKLAISLHLIPGE